MPQFDPQKYSYPSRRNVVYARRAMACTSVPLGAQIGLDVMKAGGNAVDAAVAMAAKVQGRELPDFPKETAIGALGQYVSDESIENFQPMNINFSIIAPLEKRIRKKAEKNLAIAARSLDVIDRLVAKGI